MVIPTSLFTHPLVSILWYCVFILAIFFFTFLPYFYWRKKKFHLLFFLNDIPHRILYSITLYHLPGCLLHKNYRKRINSRVCCDSLSDYIGLVPVAYLWLGRRMGFHSFSGWLFRWVVHNIIWLVSFALPVSFAAAHFSLMLTFCHVINLPTCTHYFPSTPNIIWLSVNPQGVHSCPYVSRMGGSWRRGISRGLFQWAPTSLPLLPTSLSNHCPGIKAAVFLLLSMLGNMAGIFLPLRFNYKSLISSYNFQPAFCWLPPCEKKIAPPPLHYHPWATVFSMVIVIA